LTRTPYRTLLIREGQQIRVASIYLIDRTSGTLLDAWNADPTAPPHKDDHLIGGMLTAITNFAAEALSEKESELQALDLGEARVFIRASAGYLIAIKSVGKGTRQVRRFIDTALYESMTVLTGGPKDSPKQHREVLAGLSDQVTAFLTRQKQPPILALSVFLGFFLLGGLILFQHFRERAVVDRLYSHVGDVISGHETLQAFPLKIEVMRHRNAVSVAGLVPSAADRDLLIREASARLHPVRLESKLVIVPPEPELRKVSASVSELNSQIGQMEAEATRKNAAERAVLQERIAGLQQELDRKSMELQAGLAELHRITQDPFLKLSQWVSMHAVFFAEETAYRDRDLAISTLTQLRDLLELSDSRVRVIGYTDPTGTADGNGALATMRAEKVASELEALGVSKDRLKVLGRPRGTLLSYDKGPVSSNRRVEFEISYIGEPSVPRGEPLRADAKGL
jgi:outer membrane protein OmpA-like peptidoglycan-associated protein